MISSWLFRHEFSRKNFQRTFWNILSTLQKQKNARVLNLKVTKMRRNLFFEESEKRQGLELK